MLVVTNGLVEVQCLDLDDLAGAFVGFEGGRRQLRAMVQVQKS
jgi:hypothetical protein